MKYSSYVKGMENTPAIEAYLDKRLKALRKVVKDPAAHAQVEIGKTTNHHKSGDIFRAEIKLMMSGKEFYAAVEKDDLYAAIDEMRDEIIAEVKKFKGKSETAFRRGARRMKSILKGLDPRDYNYKDWKFWEKWRRK